jgi:hypothetical protein
MEIALHAVLPLAQSSEDTLVRTVAESDQAWSAAFIVIGLLIGAYGSYGRADEFRWVTAVGIALVVLGVLIQFGTVSGDRGSAIEVVLPAAAWMVATMIGFLLATAVPVERPLGVVAKAAGVVLLGLCLAAIALPLFGIGGGPLPGPFEGIDVEGTFR